MSPARGKLQRLLLAAGLVPVVIFLAGAGPAGDLSSPGNLDTRSPGPHRRHRLRFRGRHRFQCLSRRGAGEKRARSRHEAATVGPARRPPRGADHRAVRTDHPGADRSHAHGLRPDQHRPGSAPPGAGKPPGSREPGADGAGASAHGAGDAAGRRAGLHAVDPAVYLGAGKPVAGLDGGLGSDQGVHDRPDHPDQASGLPVVDVPVRGAVQHEPGRSAIRPRVPACGSWRRPFF